MKKNIIMIIVAALILVAGAATILLMNGGNKEIPGNQTNPQPQEGTPAAGEDPGYYFEYNGVKIQVDALSTTVLDKLGEPMNYFEAPSCAFEGMDKIYTYSSFEFQTYTEDDKDFIASLHFMDDSVTTPEGIGLNASLEDVVKAYGDGYTQSFSQYTYTKGKSNLSFIIENNEVVSVEYSSAEFANTQQE